jgi:hypothetical protein
MPLQLYAHLHWRTSAGPPADQVLFPSGHDGLRPRDAVEGKNRRRFVGCCYFAAVEKNADETRDNEEVPSFDNLLNHSNCQYQ